MEPCRGAANFLYFFEGHLIIFKQILASLQKHLKKINQERHLHHSDARVKET